MGDKGICFTGILESGCLDLDAEVLGKFLHISWMAMGEQPHHEEAMAESKRTL